MCGIAGILNLRGPVDASRLKAMTDSLQHRGPDAEGWWMSKDKAVGLGNRRLAVLDLSKEGRQPMVSLDGRYCIVYNGEIYNYKEIRASHAQRGIKYHGNSDTEVLLNHFALYREKALADLDGMFSLAIWDSAEGELFCARDRFGEKPFYYHRTPGAEFLFASEIKALLVAGVRRSINHAKLFGYFRNPANPSDTARHEQTFFDGIVSLDSASFMFVRDGVTAAKKRYWSLPEGETRTGLAFDDATQEFRQIFNESVGRRLRSDVPVGSSLSGGIDSSAVVCTIRDLHPDTKYNTFSARFKGFDADEGDFMNLVNERARTIPHFVYPTETDLADDLAKLCYFQDEPVESSSAFAQWCVMRLAADHGVVVLLDGQGGDEISAGYYEYIGAYLAELSKRDPGAAAREAQAFSDRVKVAVPDSSENGTARSRLISRLKHSARRRLARTGLARSRVGETFLTRAYMWEYGFDPASRESRAPVDLNSALAADLVDGKLENYLRYADRNSMAFSREVRLPFLSHRLVEFMFSLPAAYKIHDGWTKYLVRRALDGIVPDDVLWRKEKVGFATPQQAWIRSPAIQALARDAHSYFVREGIVNKGWANKGEHDWDMIMAWLLLTGAGQSASRSGGAGASTTAREIQSPPESALLT